MKPSTDSFADCTGALAERPRKTLAQELETTRWWIQRLEAWVASSEVKRPEVYLGALNELRDHWLRAEALREGADAETGDSARRGRATAHPELLVRLESLLEALRMEPGNRPPRLLESLRLLLVDFAALDLELPHDIERASPVENAARR